MFAQIGNLGRARPAVGRMAQVRQISSILDPNDLCPKAVQELEERLAETRLRFRTREQQMGTLCRHRSWPRLNASLDLEVETPTSMQEMGTHFSRRGHAASLRAAADSSVSPLNKYAHAVAYTEQMARSNLETCTLVEDALMSHPAVYACLASDYSRHDVFTQVILDHEVNQDHLKSFAEDRIASATNIHIQVVNEIQPNSQNEDVRMQDRQKIVEFMNAYGSERSMDIDGFASFCEAYGLSNDRVASDSMFAYHDADQDGLLNFTELKQFVETITF